MCTSSPRTWTQAIWWMVVGVWCPSPADHIGNPVPVPAIARMDVTVKTAATPAWLEVPHELPRKRPIARNGPRLRGLLAVEGGHVHGHHEGALPRYGERARAATDIAYYRDQSSGT